MENNLDSHFIETYKPLIEKFIKDIQGIDPTCLPVPFIPYYGTGYEKSPYKIAFVGWETRDSLRLSEFIESYNGNSNDAYYWFREDLDDIDEDNPFPFLDKGYGYLNNFGTDFWGFILKFLACFNGIDDWKEVKNKTHPDILKSFVWGNVQSIERFEVAKRNDATIDDYNVVKNASKIFDNCKTLLQTFEPNILILLHWNAHEEWLLHGVSSYYGPEKIDDEFLWYYHIKDTNTHVYWTHHPGSISRRKINFIDFIFLILQDIKTKQIFEKFPGEELLKRYHLKNQLLKVLKEQLREAASQLSIITTDEHWGDGKESYFYFYFPNSNYQTSICFGFYKRYDDFSVGVDVENKEDNYIELKKEISIKLTPIIGIDENYENWAYLHYYRNELKNWDLNEQIWQGINNGDTCRELMSIVDGIVHSLKGIHL